MSHSSSNQAGFSNAGAVVEEAQGTIKAARVSVGDELASLHASWSGDASKTFVGTCDQWAQKADKIISEMTTLVNNIRDSGISHARGEEQAQTIAASNPVAQINF